MEINVIPENFEPPHEDNYPFPAPFILSSVERSWCMADKAKIIYIKRRHLEENLKVIAGEIGMSDADMKDFLDYWCSNSRKGPTEIRAEGDEYWNLRYRAERWMKKSTSRNARPQQSRLERYAESARQAFAGTQSVPPGNTQPAGPGYAVLPDEQ